MGLACELMDEAEKHLAVAGAQRIYLMVKETATLGRRRKELLAIG